MIRTILLFGLAGALVVGALMVSGSLPWAQGQQAPPEAGVVVGYVTQLVALIAVFLGIKHHRDVVLGGVIKFFPAFGLGAAISAVASLGWVISWEIVLAISSFDLPAVMEEQMLAQAQARGASEAELQKIAQESADFAKLYGIPPVRWAISFIEMFPVGILVSLVSAAILRNSRFMPVGQAAQ